MRAGSRVRLVAVFKNIDQRLVDPEAVTVTVVHGDGTVDHFSIGHGVRRSGVGECSVEIILRAAGTCAVTFTSTGIGQEHSSSHNFDVDPADAFLSVQKKESKAEQAFIFPPPLQESRDGKRSIVKPEPSKTKPRKQKRPKITFKTPKLVIVSRR